jgi:hypothetical protein
MKPPTELMEEKQAFQWTLEMETAFQTLKEALCTVPILAYPQPREKFIVDTDASDVGIGGVISTYRTDRSVIAYYSKTLNRAKRSYCITRRELLAFVRTLENFHKYLYGQDFHMHTDHSALTWLISFKKLKVQTSHWIQRLQEQNFTSEHHQGRKHSNADALSRRSCQEECTHCHKVEARVGIKQVQTIEAVAAASWVPAALKTERPGNRIHSGRN